MVVLVSTHDVAEAEHGNSGAAADGSPATWEVMSRAQLVSWLGMQCCVALSCYFTALAFESDTATRALDVVRRWQWPRHLWQAQCGRLRRRGRWLLWCGGGRLLLFKL